MQNSSTAQIVAGLSHAFRQEIDKIHPRINTKGSPIYVAQVDFMYAIDDVQRGNTVEVEAGISAARKIITNLRQAD